MANIISKGGPPTFEDIALAFRHPISAAILTVLTEGERSDLNALAEGIARDHAELVGYSTSNADIERLKVYLYHVYLPKLDRYGLVEFDSEQRSVRAIERPEAAERAMEFIASANKFQ